MRHLLTLAVVLVMTAGCSSKKVTPERGPIGLPFPRITGESLSGDTVILPDDVRGSPALLIVGYSRKAQFDIDRWMYGILNANLRVRVLELPTIDSLRAHAASSFIDDGMRSGIPEEEWGSVVTVYGSAPKIMQLLGKEREQNGQVVLLDSKGEVRWFHNRGFSASKLVDLQRSLESLR